MTQTARETLAGVIEQLHAPPRSGPTAVNLTSDDAPPLAWDFSGLKPGDKVFYRTASRKRERMGYFREVSECGRVVKLTKVSRRSWVGVEDITGFQAVDPQELAPVEI